MSDPKDARAASARPRQLTMASWFVIGASVLLVLTAFDSLASLTSVEKREELTELLSEPPFEGLGVSVAEALDVTRVALMVAAACAAAAAVLGVFVLQRHRGARLALSLVAVPLVLSTFVTGDLLGVIIAAATLMLWTGPARDWFAGRPVRQVERPDLFRRSEGPPEPGSTPWDVTRPPAGPPHDDQRPEPAEEPRSTDDRDADQRPGAPEVSSLSTSDPSRAPAATSGYGQRPTALAEAPAPAWSGPVPPAYSPPASTSVPVPVKIACVLTWTFSGVVALMYAALMAVLAADSDRLVDFVVSSPEWERANLDEDLLLPMLWVGCLMFLGWALGACILAWFTWRRHNWARWLLAASAATAMVAALFAFPVGLLHQVAAGLTLVGLFSAASRAWFAPQHSAPYYPPGPPNGPGGDPAGPPAGQQGPSAWSGTAPSDPDRQDDKPPVW